MRRLVAVAKRVLVSRDVELQEALARAERAELELQAMRDLYDFERRAREGKLS